MYHIKIGKCISLSVCVCDICPR